MRKPDRKIERLGELRLFAACTPRELERISRSVTEHRAAAGEVLVRQDAVGREFFVLAEGVADVVVDDRRVARLDAGDFFGEIALLDRGRRTATVVAVTDVVLFVSSAPEFVELLGTAPDMTRRLLTGLAGRVRAAASAS